MFFSTCEFACPLLVQDLKRLEAALPASIRDQVDFVLVSFDTERDTPEALAAYRARQSLDPARWCLLTGRPDDVRDLAAILGIRYAKDARGQFMHSNVLTLLDRNGEVSHQEMGLNRPLESLLGAMEASAMNTALPTPPDHRAQ
jgi:protein SCO1/2